jgi:hypothetical protein
MPEAAVNGSIEPGVATIRLDGNGKGSLERGSGMEVAQRHIGSHFSGMARWTCKLEGFRFSKQALLEQTIAMTGSMSLIAEYMKVRHGYLPWNQIDI